MKFLWFAVQCSYCTRVFIYMESVSFFQFCTQFSLTCAIYVYDSLIPRLLPMWRSLGMRLCLWHKCFGIFVVLCKEQPLKREDCQGCFEPHWCMLDSHRLEMAYNRFLQLYLSSFSFSSFLLHTPPTTCVSWCSRCCWPPLMEEGVTSRCKISSK